MENATRILVGLEFSEKFLVLEMKIKSSKWKSTEKEVLKRETLKGSIFLGPRELKNLANLLAEKKKYLW